MYTVKVEYSLKNNPTAADIRTAVFVHEQGFKDEFDQREESSHHLVIFEGQTPVATARAYRRDSGQVFIIGRVAVDAAWRGKGLGKMAVLEMEKYLKKLGAEQVEISAQLSARGFYEKLGYTAFGEVHMDEHVQHINMKKLLPL